MLPALSRISLRPRPKQIPIVFEQLCNTLLDGWAEEIFSARCRRLRARGRGFLRNFIDRLAWTCGGKHHCEESWKSETRRRRLPEVYKQ